MGNKAELFIKQIDDLLATVIKVRDRYDGSAVGKVSIGAISIANSLYGATSPQVKTIEKRIAEFAKMNPDAREDYLLPELHGFLQTIRDEIEAGLITTLQAEARGEMLADFIVMAKAALDDGSKDVAAVLACAALEDTLKRYAQLNGLSVEDSEMSEVINALKSRGLVKGARGQVLGSFITVRNKAFHAQWDKIEATEVQSIVAFVQEFLTTEFATIIGPSVYES